MLLRIRYRREGLQPKERPNNRKIDTQVARVRKNLTIIERLGILYARLAAAEL